jgi:hypothetical protein
VAEYDRLAGIKGRFVRWLRYEPRTGGDVLTLDADEVGEVVEQLQYAVDTILRQRQELHEYRLEVRRLNMQLNRSGR